MFEFISGLLLAIMFISNVVLFSLIGILGNHIHDKLRDEFGINLDNLENRIKVLEDTLKSAGLNSVATTNNRIGTLEEFATNTNIDIRDLIDRIEKIENVSRETKDKQAVYGLVENPQGLG